MPFRYHLHPDGVSIIVSSGSKAPSSILHTDHTQISTWDAPDESFNFGVRRHPVLLASGDRPRLALMRNLPVEQADPALVKLGDGRFHIQLGEQAAWLDEFEQIETTFNPSAVIHQVQDNRFPDLVFTLKSALAYNWGILAMLTVTNTGTTCAEFAVQMVYGGLRLCPRTFSAAYFPEQPDDAHDNLTELNADNAALLHGEGIPDWVGVLGLTCTTAQTPINPVETLQVIQPAFREGKAHFHSQPSLAPSGTAHFFLLAVRADTKEAAANLVSAGAAGQWPFTMPQSPPTAAAIETIFLETARYYQAVLQTYQIDTPNPVIDHAFRTSLWNLDSVYAFGPWLEGAHWWSAPWTNLFQISAAIALGQYERAAVALRYFSGHGFGVVKATGACDPGHDGLFYYINALTQYTTSTGDLALAREVWPAFTGAVSELLAARCGAGRGLLDWQLHCNPFLYQADHLGLPGEAASPSLMAAAMLERLASLARQLGETPQADEWVTRARLIYTGLKDRLWDDAAGYFYGHVDLQSLAHHAHYYTDLCYPALYTSLPANFQQRSLDHLCQSLLYEAFPSELDGAGALEMRAGDYLPTIFGNNNVMPTQTCEGARACFHLGDHVTGTRLLEGVALAGTVHTEAPGNFPEHMSFLGKGEANYLFGNPIASFALGVVDGLFGVHFEAGGAALHWQPGFPDDWDHASLRLPDARVDYHQVVDNAGVHRTYRVHAKGQSAQLRLTLDPTLIRAFTVSGISAVPNLDADGQMYFNAPLIAGTAVFDLQLVQQPVSLPRQYANPLSTHIESRFMDSASLARMNANSPVESINLSDLYNSSSLRVTSAWRNLDLSPDLTPLRDAEGCVSCGGSSFLVPAQGHFMALVEMGHSDPITRQLHPSPHRSRLVIPVDGMVAHAVALLFANEVESRHTGAQVGEIILRYHTNRAKKTPLVVGEQLDTYWSHFARQTIPVRLGDTNDYLNALWLECDPTRVLKKIEIRITAPDALVGLIGMNVIL